MSEVYPGGCIIYYSLSMKRYTSFSCEMDQENDFDRKSYLQAACDTSIEGVTRCGFMPS